MAAKSGQGPETRAILALARGEPIADAARLSGLSQRTIQRRLADPEFVRQVKSARTATIGRATGRLAGAAEDAVRALRGLLGAESETVRLSAAKAVLELSMRFRDAAEIEDRLTELEDQIHGVLENRCQAEESATDGRTAKAFGANSAASVA